MNILGLSKDNILNIIIDNHLSLQGLENLYNTSKNMNKILNYIKHNWFNIVDNKNKNIYYRIYHAPLNCIIVNYDYIYNLLNNISIHKKYIIIHYLFARYNSNGIFNTQNILTHQYLLKLCKMILISNKITHYTKRYLIAHIPKDEV